MMSTNVSNKPTTEEPYKALHRVALLTPKHGWRNLFVLPRLVWICLLLACVGASWFSYQYFLVPQSRNFAPDWQGARWVQSADGDAPVAYFRFDTDLNTLPDGAFITIAANQVFRLYVNGVLIGSNSTDFVQGNFPRAYMYDLASSLHLGSNVIGVRVANVDEQSPSVRVSFGIIQGKFIFYHGSGPGWQATVQSTAVYPRYATSVNLWATTKFDASSWLPVREVGNVTTSPMLTVNPLVYEQPIPSNWISAGGSHDTYFVRQFSLPFGITGCWLRLAATGTASIFINGHLSIVWNGQAPIRGQNLADYLSSDYLGSNETTVQYRAGLAMGVYDISSYLHPGVNIIAVHVVAPGISAAQVGLDNLNAATALDILRSDFWGNNIWVAPNTGWHSSSLSTQGWAEGSSTALAWPQPIIVGRPGASQAFYLQDSSTPRNTQIFPVTSVILIVLLSSSIVIGLWLLLSLVILRNYWRSLRDALETMSLIYLPAVAFEALLVVLSREPQIPRPFPYTWFWGSVLIILVAISCFLLWLNARTVSLQHRSDLFSFANKEGLYSSTAPLRAGLLKLYRTYPRSLSSSKNKAYPFLRNRMVEFIRIHWVVIPLILLAIPMICYNLSYEPHWQDELASYYATQGVLVHGLPVFPSGFLYTKAEFFSYLLGLWTVLFGGQAGNSRMLSALEYLASLPLLYAVGCYFFDRRISLLATAMLAYSPISLIWGRQMRMYEQAQLLTLLVIFLFYKALREIHRPHFVYLAAFCLVLDYLSHEEIFIILPALVICLLVFGRDSEHRFPIVLYQKHWWYAAAIAITAIGLQLLASKLTHPPILGTDRSQIPLIGFTTDNIPYYFYLLFLPNVLGHGTLPWITISSVLATLGCFCARRSTDVRIKYCALLLVISICTLALVFTLQADRYIYPILPIYYLMGAYAMLVILRVFWTFARSRLVLQKPETNTRPVFGGYLTKSMRVIALFTGGLVCACVLVVPILPISSYNLFISKVAGFSYHRHYSDYDAVGEYMQQHWHKGDIVIAVSPAISVLYYVGHVDYFFSLDRALYLFESNGHIIDTATGSTPLLNQDDFASVLTEHNRVWIISDNGQYQAAVMKRFAFPPDFRIVFEGYGSAIYFRGG